MQKASTLSFFKALFSFITILFLSVPLLAGAQDNTAGWTPEEQKELFGYCEKGVLVKKLNISPETADKIGQINYWATVTKISVAANTNDTFATPKEVEDVVVKKYKALGLSGDQLKELLARRERTNNGEPCAVTVLNVNHVFDTITVPRAMLQYKAITFRKPLIDKLGIVGRQADMLFDVEIWKQKEAVSIAAIPVTDFNRIRRTVNMYNERERRFKVVGLTDQQIEAAVEYFDQHPIK